MARDRRGTGGINTVSVKGKLRADGGTDNETDPTPQRTQDEPPSQRAGDRGKMSRGEKFHQNTGDFKDVAVALGILIVLGIIAYVIFVL